MNFWMLSKMPRPSSTALTIEAKLSSVSTMSDASLRHVGAGDAHGDADIGRLHGRRVVHAVAGHGHDFAAALPGPHNAQLVLGRDARIDR